jgi:uncharacterized protein
VFPMKLEYRSVRHAVLIAALSVASACTGGATSKYTDVGVTSEDGFVAAAGQGDQAAVDAFLAAGVDINARDRHGSTALMAAAGSGRVDVMQALIAKGADINATKPDGWTPLIAAAQAGSGPAVRALLEAGAQPENGNGEGYTALMAAAQSAQRER